MLVIHPINYTPRKFYGKFFHDIIRHAPVQQRLICGLSANSENEERYFNTIKSIPNTTSNKKNEDILSNLFIRVQVEGKMKEIKSQDSEIGKIWQVIESAGDSKIHFTIIKKYPYE